MPQTRGGAPRRNGKRLQSGCDSGKGWDWGGGGGGVFGGFWFVGLW